MNRFIRLIALLLLVTVVFLQICHVMSDEATQEGGMEMDPEPVMTEDTVVMDANEPISETVVVTAEGEVLVTEENTVPPHVTGSGTAAAVEEESVPEQHDEDSGLPDSHPDSVEEKELVDEMTGEAAEESSKPVAEEKEMAVTEPDEPSMGDTVKDPGLEPAVGETLHEPEPEPGPEPEPQLDSKPDVQEERNLEETVEPEVVVTDDKPETPPTDDIPETPPAKVSSVADSGCPSRDQIAKCAGKYMDTNQNGKLDRSELQDAVKKLPWYGRGILQILGGVNDMMKKCDMDGDDAISLDYDMQNSNETCLAACYKRRLFKSAFFPDCDL